MESDVGYIYKITNIVNGKIYIGQTRNKVEDRWKQHIVDSKTPTGWQVNSILYKSIRKYGEKSFNIEIVEECDNQLLNEREKYWIKYYNSYAGNKGSNGYNLTLGGDGCKKYDCEIFEKLWRKGLSASEIARQMGCARHTVILFLKTIPGYEERAKKDRYKAILKVNQSKNTPIDVYNLDGVFIKTFISQVEAAKELHIDKGNISAVLKGKSQCVGEYQMVYHGENPPNYFGRKKKVIQFDECGGFVNEFDDASQAAKAVNGDSSSISKCCRGERATAYGYMWKYKKRGELSVV